MRIKILSNAVELPPEAAEFKKRHFQDVFGGLWESVYNQNPASEQDEKILIIEDGAKTAGWVQFQEHDYCIKFKNFSVHPDFRGQGIARMLMERLAQVSVSHHHELLAAGEKPADIGLMFLKSLVYFDADHEGEAFAFGKFLRRFGFIPYPYNKNDISGEERAGIAAYAKLYPELASRLKVFKKITVNTGVELKESTKNELLQLAPEEWEVTMRGLAVKLGNYAKSGRVSYRYDLCPICAHMGSSEQDDENCGKCFIRQTCFEPFRKPARFKEDYEISGAYFEAVRQFLLAHRPKGVEK